MLLAILPLHPNDKYYSKLSEGIQAQEDVPALKNRQSGAASRPKNPARVRREENRAGGS